MAKKGGRKGKKAGKKVSKKKGGRRLTAAQKQERQRIKKKNSAKRIELHKASTLLADFHGGKGPVKSGCGRPRGS